MNRFMTVAGMLPPQLFVMLLVGAGIALIVGAKRVAATLVATVVAGAFLPVILDPIIASLPLWLLLILGVFAGFAVLRMLMELVIGKGSTDHAIGALMAFALKGILLFPFHLLTWVVRSIFRLGTR